MERENITSTKVLVYDLPSENINNIPKEIKNKIRNCRVKSTKLLHGLGIQATESVILIAPSKLERVNSIIEKVNQLYANLGLGLNPIILTMPITQNQQASLSVLASNRINQQVQETINRISLLIDNLAQITESRIRNRVRSNITELRRTYVTLKQICDELGIQISDMDYLIQLIDQALSQI